MNGQRMSKQIASDRGENLGNPVSKWIVQYRWDIVLRLSITVLEYALFWVS